MDRLARNAMLAREAGMSYGKWKALQPVVEVEKQEPENMAICEWCKKPFKKRNHKRFCNYDCRVQAYAEKNRQINAEMQRRWRQRQKEDKDEKTAEV